ncbi:MAG: GNAT family N-acetyltransferase [Mycoplasmatota bacterium]
MKNKNINFKNVDNEADAILCDSLLTKLISSERKFDENVKPTYIVKDLYTKKYFQNFNCLILAVDGENPIGFIFGYMKFEAGEFCYNSTGFVDALFVEKEYRNNGIATSLTNLFVDWCKTKGIKEIEIGVFIDNKSAYKLYESLNFIPKTIYLKKEI